MTKARYCIGYFENGYEVVAIGFKHKSEKQLAKKLRQAEGYGWRYDDAWFPDMREADELPDYIKVRF